MTGWVRTWEHNGDYLESLGGVIWGKAPMPRRWHRCRPQTRGWHDGDYTERCACGAIRSGASDPWMEKNQTRKDRARQRREDRKPRVTVTCTDCGQPYEAAEGSHQAADRQCNSCWGDALIASSRGSRP